MKVIALLLAFGTAASACTTIGCQPAANGKYYPCAGSDNMCYPYCCPGYCSTAPCSSNDDFEVLMQKG